MGCSDKEKVDYLLKYCESTQARLNQIDERGAGAINLAAVVAAVAAAVGLFVGEESVEKGICILIPACVVVVISIHCYNNRMIAILSGCIAGAEDVLAGLIGKNIYINNQGLKRFRHTPYFVTNDLMGIMYLVIGLIGSGYAFYRIQLNSYIPKLAFIIYLGVFALFCLIYIYELWSNEAIKKHARNYYHILYDQAKVKKSAYDFDAFDKEFNKQHRKEYFTVGFRKKQR